MTLLRQLNTLESAGLVRIAQLEPDLEYLFRHALVREAAYSSLLSADQKELHLAVGEAIERLYPEKIDEYAAMLSYHFGEAGDEQKAQKYCVIAGKSALASFANQEAENHFRCALNLVSQKSERADLIYLLGEALFRQSRYDEAIQTWREGIQLYKQQGELPEMARLYARSARAAWYYGEHPEGLRLSLEGWESVKEMPENPSKAMLIHELSRAYHFNGYPEEAEPLCRQALAMSERVGAVDTQADTLTTLGVLPNVPGDESLEYLTRAVQLAESNGLLEIATRANHNLGVMTGEHLGDQKAASVHYLRAAELAKQRGAAQEEIFSLTQVAGMSMAMGELKTAQELMTRIETIRTSLTEPSQGEFEFAGIQFGLKFLSGEIKDALEIVRKVRVEARERGDLQMLYNYCTNLADVFIVLDHVEGVEDWSEAEQAAKEAVEISSRGVSSSIQSHSQLATIYIRQGKLDEARQHYSDTQQIAGAAPTFWQKQALLNIERDLAKADGDWEAALAAAEAASKHLAHTGLRWPWSYSLIEWAETHLARGEALDYERASTLYREALAVFAEMESLFFVELLEGRLRELRAKTIAVTVAHDVVTQELEEAGKIQGSFLPEEIPDIPGWDISAILQPARETSGDFYDFIHLPGNKLGMVVADVADKGIGAALYMTTCRTLIRTYAGEHPDAPELVLAKANRRILADTHGGLFITVFYAVLDASSGEIIYCNAGHNPPFVFLPNKDGTHLELSRTGMPLGILSDGDWEQERVTLDAGSLLIGYTDGITENQNEDLEFFGEERLAAVVGANLSQAAKTIQDFVLDGVQRFSGSSPQGDDMTLLVVKRAS
jgi:tetratricopeptide (TPR) repeat protein